MAWRLYNEVKVDQSLAGENWATGANGGAEIDCEGFDRVMYVLNAGTVGSSGTVDGKVQEAAAAGGSYSDISGGALVQITAANDDAEFIVDVPVNSAKPVQKFLATVATAACDLGVIAILYRGNRTLPPSQTKTVVAVD